MKELVAVGIEGGELPVSFRNDPLATLDAYRNQLFHEELSLRK